MFFRMDYLCLKRLGFLDVSTQFILQKFQRNLVRIDLISQYLIKDRELRQASNKIVRMTRQTPQEKPLSQQVQHINSLTQIESCLSFPPEVPVRVSIGITSQGKEIIRVKYLLRSSFQVRQVIINQHYGFNTSQFQTYSLSDIFMMIKSEIHSATLDEKENLIFPTSLEQNSPHHRLVVFKDFKDAIRSDFYQSDILLSQKSSGISEPERDPSQGQSSQEQQVNIKQQNQLSIDQVQYLEPEISPEDDYVSSELNTKFGYQSQSFDSQNSNKGEQPLEIYSCPNRFCETSLQYLSVAEMVQSSRSEQYQIVHQESCSMSHQELSSQMATQQSESSVQIQEEHSIQCNGSVSHPDYQDFTVSENKKTVRLNKCNASRYHVYACTASKVRPWPHRLSLRFRVVKSKHMNIMVGVCTREVVNNRLLFDKEVGPYSLFSLGQNLCYDGGSKKPSLFRGRVENGQVIKLIISHCEEFLIWNIDNQPALNIRLNELLRGKLLVPILLMRDHEDEIQFV